MLEGTGLLDPAHPQRGVFGALARAGAKLLVEPRPRTCAQLALLLARLILPTGGTLTVNGAKLADLPDQKFTLAEVDRLDVLVQSGTRTKPGLMLGAASARLPAAATR